MTNKPSQPTEEEIFLAVSELEDPQARAEYLDRACAGDASLRQRIERLLEAQERADVHLGESGRLPAADRLKAVADAQHSEGPGTVIGRYKLLEKIGEGGMGVVYMAEQTEPYVRKVALKIIKLGMDTKQVVARFEAERQALAMMDHPHIARVLDGGATETGRPYFVMELVRGIPITEYCDKQKLTTRERLELFIPVCQAIQHAHQKGIIHRDLKPGNVLVTMSDGTPHPMVIDFGVAKATNQKLTEKTLFTNFAQMIGTPAYMSPEQAEMSRLDVDTRSDVYSLGVLLYELLTGSQPFPEQELRSASWAEVQRIIAEKEPPKPSTRMSTLTVEQQTDLSRRRHESPRHISGLLQGDLDWIVMKAIEKDRCRRYETANGLSMDVQRYLADEPVTARPPSRLYEVQKTVRRHKFGFAAAAALGMSLLAGTVFSTWQAVRAARAEREQNRLREQAETEAAKAMAVSKFLQSMLSSAIPTNLKGADYTVRQLLDDFSLDIAKRLEDQPEVEATVQFTIGEAYNQLELTDKAMVHLERSLALRRQIYGSDSQPVVESLVECAWVMREPMGATLEKRWEMAKPYIQEAKEICRQHSDAWRESLVEVVKVEQFFLIRLKRYAEAEAALREAMTLVSEPSSIEARRLATFTHQLAWAVLDQQGRHKEAEREARKELEIHHGFRSAEDLPIAWCLERLALSLRRQGNFADARACYEEALTIFSQHYSHEHQSVRWCMGGLASTLQDQKDWPAAESLCRQLLAAERAALRQGDPSDLTANVNVARALYRLAEVLEEQDRIKQAEPYYRECIDMVSKLEDPSGDQMARKLASLLAKLARFLIRHGESDEAEALARKCLAIREEFYPEEWFRFDAQSLLGASLLGQKRFKEAEEFLLVGYHGMKEREDQIPAASRSFLKEALERLVQLYEAWGRPDEAQRWKVKLQEF